MSMPPEWRTHAELTDYRETPNYADSRLRTPFGRRFAAIEYRGFGHSGQGRKLPLLIASETGTLTPEAAQAEGKAVV